MRYTVLTAALLLVIAAVAFNIPMAIGSPAIDEIPANYVPSGEVLYKQYCAACHGLEAKGNGPAAPTLKMPVPDLTTLAARHQGKFPRDYVSNILRFGPGPSAHGSSDMPTWGPIFQIIDKNNERAVQQRIKNLTDYLASLQEK